MFAIPGITLLIAFLYLRPLEFVPALRAVPLLYLFVALSLFGLAVDLKLRISKPVFAPQLGWVVAFAVWCLVTVAVRMPEKLLAETLPIVICVLLFVLVGHSVQTFRGLQWVAGLVLVLVLWLSFVGIH